MANYYTQYSFQIQNITEEEEAWLRGMLAVENDSDGDDLVLPSFLFERDGLWIYDDYGGSHIDYLAELLQGFLQEFRPDDHIAFSWADTCSKPRIDSFGGGAVFITAEEISWTSTYDWIGKHVARMKEKRHE